MGLFYWWGFKAVNKNELIDGCFMKKLFLVVLFGLGLFSALDAMDYGYVPECVVCLKELRSLTKVIPDCGHTQCVHCFVFHKYCEHSQNCQLCGKPVGTETFKVLGNRFINIFDAGRDQSAALDLCEQINSLNHFKFNEIIEELELLKCYSADKDLTIHKDIRYLLTYYLNFRHKRFENKTPMEIAREVNGRDGSFFRRLQHLAK